MARQTSKMLPLGTPAPPFALPDTVTGKTVAIGEFASSPALLVAFICNHCPFVRHIRGEFSKFTKEYAAKGLKVVAIASNSVQEYPEDGPTGMKQEATEVGYDFPYLFDFSQQVAKQFNAACTPDFFLFDGKGRLAYRGQFDGSRPKNNVPVNGADMRAAVDAVLAGRGAADAQRASMGCNIKWYPGNEPQYFKV